jgi:pantothenate kinase
LPQGYEPDLATLVDRARALLTRSERTILGICGAPGAGKSTLAAAITEALGPAAVLAPMDGFHLSDDELERLGRRNRKGAPDTFDAAGFIDLLRRIERQTDEVVYAPAFDRQIEATVPDAIAIDRRVRLVVTEGNYLLLADAPWSAIGPLLDECWYIEGPEDERLRRLVARHVEFGKTPQGAHEWVQRSDAANARLIEASRHRADVIVRLSPDRHHRDGP